MFPFFSKWNTISFILSGAIMKRLFSSLSVLFSLLLSMSFQNLEAFSNREVFAKHPNPYFIETGSYQGDGIQRALDAGFSCIYSIELSASLHAHCKNRFAWNPGVHLVLGDSSTVLSLVLDTIDAPATFWLDGHYSSGITARGKTNTPILKELEAIAQHPIKNHTILIDDVRCCGTADFDFVTLDEIIAAILTINPAYQIHYEDGYCRNDILVATVQ